MHEDEVRATPELVERLVAEQCPQWADLPVTALADEFEGTDNVLFRLGDELVARMPKVAWAPGPGRVRRALAARLAPAPARSGARAGPRRPARRDGYPWAWSVVPWVAGSHTAPRLGVRRRAARPRPRGLRPAACARSTPPAVPPSHRAHAALRSRHVDDVRRERPSSACAPTTTASTSRRPRRAWEPASPRPTGTATPCGSTATSSPATSSSTTAGLVAVIDWGALGVGDPAPDVAAALWTFTGDGPRRLPGGGLPRRRHVAPRLRLGARPVAHRHRLLPAHLPPDGRARPPHGARRRRRADLS